MKPNVSQYLSNFPTFLAWRSLYISEYWKGTSLVRKIIMLLIVADVFVNTLTGGDPRETISSSIHKDRKSAWFPAFLINMIEGLDEDHGPQSHNPSVGEGSEDNRELPGKFRTALVVFWIGVLAVAGDIGWDIVGFGVLPF